jgi:serine/threonine protein kinase/tetratricopeptide (TPR) repeat protein
VSLALPHAFGRYTLTERIGEGGMAEVYLADVPVAEGLIKRVVIKKIRKELADQPEFTRMFVEEAKIALGLNHANIVQVFDFGQVHGSFYLAMELVEGLDLMRLVHAIRERGERVPVVIAGYIAHQVAAGLAYAHQRKDDFGRPLGIVHRDISPHNIMLSLAGTVKVLDFGIARTAARARDVHPFAPHSHHSLTPPDGPDITIQGKIAYMSPEQAHGGPLDQRSDIYSLGVVLYELLVGELVFRHRDRLVALEQVRTRPLPALGERAPDVPEALAAVVDRALARDPERRWDTARAMQSALAAFLHRADPVVDDEVLSAFVARHAGPAHHGPAAPRVERDEHSLGTQIGALTSDLQPRRVVLLRATLAPALAGERPPAPTQFLALARDIAYKRDARVVELDVTGVLLAFGTELDAGDTDDLAVRTALALRDAVGEAAPGYGLGVALAGLVLPGASGGVDVPSALATRLHAIAGAALDATIMVAGDLPVRLRRAWRVGHAHHDAPHNAPRDAAADRHRRSAPGSSDISDLHLAPVPVRDDTDLSRPRRSASGSSDSSDLGRPAPAPVRDDRDGDTSAPAASDAPDALPLAPLLGPAGEPEPRTLTLTAGRPVLVGRELELKAVRDAFAEAIRGRSARAVLVVGEAGMGKRALVDRFVAGLPRAACVVLRGGGQWRRRNSSLGAFLDLLRDYLEVDETTTPADLEARLAATELGNAEPLALALAAALGLPGAADREPDPLERRDRVWRLARRLIRALARRRPVLLVLEQLHFLDEHSLRLLAAWLHRRPALPLLVLATARPGPRADAFRPLPGVHTVELRELDAHARRDLVLRRFDDPADAEPLAAAILAHTGGNPLFIEETLADLLRRGILGWAPGGRHLQVRQRGATIDVHPTIEAALQARLDALDPDDRDLVDAAAVLGASFRLGELAALLARPPEPVTAAAARLVDHGLFAAEPGARHPAARFATLALHDVVKHHLSPGTAAGLHRQAAAIKQRRADHKPGQGDGPIADHYAQAGDLAAAVDPAMRAARSARDVAGNVEAHHYWTVALRAMDPADPRRLEALLARADILQAWGRRRAQGADVRQILLFAERSGDPEIEVVALARLLRFYIEVERLHRADQIYPRLVRATEALVASDPTMDLHRAVGGEIGAELMTARGQIDEAEALARGALAHCPPGARGLQQRCRLLTCIGRAQLADGELALARDSFEATLELARGAGHRRLEAEALTRLGEVAGRRGDYQEAVDLLRAALQIDRDLGDRSGTGLKLANLGMAYTAIGVYHRADRYLRKALELHEALGHAGLMGDVVVHLGEVSAELGDTAGARALLEQAAGMAAARGDVRTELRARARLARALLDAGLTSPTSGPELLADAESIATAVLTRASEHNLRTSRVRALHVLSRLAERAGDLPLAIAREEEATALVNAGAAPLDGVLSLHHLGRLTGRADLLTAAAARVRARLEGLTDPELRRGYLAQDKVREILADAGDPLPA